MTRIALVNPLGDPGIGTYTHELAEAMVALGWDVDVFTAPNAWALSLARHHRIFPVTGSALIRQRDAIRNAARQSEVVPAAAKTAESNAAANAAGAAQSPTRRPALLPGFLKGVARDGYLNVEFPLWLKSRGYDVLWTQWPTPPVHGVSVWSAAKALGLRVVHTAHNVFPHEISAKDREECGHVYRWSERIVVHSEMACDSLRREFPFTADKLVIAHHGLYTTYPASPRGRDAVRQSLGIAPDKVVALCFGGIRPYKNTDAVISALALDSEKRFELIVAGREAGYPEQYADDPLGRTRRLVREAGISDRAHLIEGPFSYPATSDLFAAADVVLLPYVESWGSGLLLLAMSFGKAVIVTRTGGMDEYVEQYPASVVLDDPSPDKVLAALQLTAERARRGGVVNARPAHLEWTEIVRDLVPKVLS